MIHPSYVELMDVVNADTAPGGQPGQEHKIASGEEPVVNSRYSIVCAAARRARQLIDGSEPLIPERNAYGRKPLSIAVDELSDGELKILTPEEANEEQQRLDEMIEKTKALREEVKQKHTLEESA